MDNKKTKLMKALCYFGYNVSTEGVPYIYSAEPTITGKYKYYKLLELLDTGVDTVAEIVENLKTAYYMGFNNEICKLEPIDAIQEHYKYYEIMELITEAYNCGLMDSEDTDAYPDVSEIKEHAEDEDLNTRI